MKHFKQLHILPCEFFANSQRMDIVPALEALQDSVRDRPRTIGWEAEFGLDLFHKGFLA